MDEPMKLTGYMFSRAAWFQASTQFTDLDARTVLFGRTEYVDPMRSAYPM